MPPDSDSLGSLDEFKNPGSARPAPWKARSASEGTLKWNPCRLPLAASPVIVIPAQAGIQSVVTFDNRLDSGSRFAWPE